MKMRNCTIKWYADNAAKIFTRYIVSLIISQIVGAKSAILQLGNEISFGIDANHKDMCKFSGADSQKYLPVEGAIKELVNSVIRASVTCT
jgi:hypothetical protein